VASPARDDRVHAAQHFGAGLDLAGVHGEHDARAPVEEALPDRVADGTDDLACQAAHTLAGFFVGDVAGDFFEEDGYALHRLVAQRALVRGELEGVGDLVGEGRDVLVGWEGRGRGREVLVLEEAVLDVSVLIRDCLRLSKLTICDRFRRRWHR
jgi:hypothetical protein